MKHPTLWLWLGLCALAALIFSLWPELDRWVSQLAYDPARGFIGERLGWVEAIYASARWLTIAALLLGLTLLAGSFVKRWQGRWRQRGVGVFLLASLLLGPGLMVNGVLKEHWGRARPHQVVDFGGSKSFTPALLPTHNCESNCSFVSGHSSIGFWWLALGLAWPAWRWRAMALGVVLGGALSVARIMQGGHFLSDTVFSFLVVWGVAEALAWLFRRQGWLPAPSPNTRT
ncbi:MAG: phosphatase PAP2 family protein [Halothiobacillaceae bacterium]